MVLRSSFALGAARGGARVDVVERVVGGGGVLGVLGYLVGDACRWGKAVELVKKDRKQESVEGALIS